MLLSACSNSSVCRMFWGAEKAPLKCDKTELQNWRNVSNCIFPPRFLLSSAIDHPPPTSSTTVYPNSCALAGRPPHTPPQYFCYLQGRIKGGKESNQVPYFSCRSWWNVSSDKTHSGRDPPFIMFQTRNANRGGSAGAGNEAFLRLSGAKRSSLREKSEEAPWGRREVKTHPPLRASSTGSIRYRNTSRCRTSNSRFRSTNSQSLKRSARTAGSNAHTLGHISHALFRTTVQ